MTELSWLCRCSFTSLRSFSAMYSRAYAHPHMPPKHVVAKRLRGPPSLPVELWQKIFGFLPRWSQLHCLLVCRWFYQMSAPLGFRSLKFHMDPSYFDRCNTWFPGKSRHAHEHSTVRLSHQALERICENPPWASFVESVVVFVRDSSSSSYFQLLTTALRRLPRLRQFHVVVTSWGHGDVVQRLERRPIQAFVNDVLATSSELIVLTLPPLYVFVT
ncbi:hypothetical protein BDW22DRAFT_135758 [Trametopsis cervina]|nr:hypothetical protein BDW22DRAFT_135758 [Trametopsis cervina]